MLEHDRPAECVRTLRPDDRRPADRISHFRGFGKRFFGNRLFRHGIFPCGAALCVPARFFARKTKKSGGKSHVGRQERLAAAGYGMTAVGIGFRCSL